MLHKDVTRKFWPPIGSGSRKNYKEASYKAAYFCKERLAITLRYLVSGDSQESIAFLFKVAHSTVNGIINETCDVLWNALFEYVTPPSYGSNWKKKLVLILNRYGICLTALEILMGSILRWKTLRYLVPYGIITKGFSAWFCLQYAMLVIIFQQKMLCKMGATMMLAFC